MHSLLKHLQGSDFRKEWSIWGCHMSGPHSFHDQICNMFTERIEITKIMECVLYETLVSQLNMLKHMNYSYEELEFDFILKNSFDNINELYMKYVYMIKSAKLIQRYWRESISNPNFKMCRNRLLNEFDSIVSDSARP